MKDMAEISSEDGGNHKENNDSQGSTEDVTHNPVNELMEDNASKGASVFFAPPCDTCLTSTRFEKNRQDPS